MADELLQMCPEQFIEGINEGEEPATERFFQISSYPSIAIEYTPGVTFCLTRIELFVIWWKFVERVEYGVKLYSGYKDSPTDIVLTNGKLVFEVTESGYDWRNIDLDEPSVVIANKKYWLGLESRQALFALAKAKDGVGVAIRAYVNGIWSPGGDESERFMLRFYGRILPVAK